MRLEQKTVTTVIADEGKVLRKKSTGAIAGERVTLGYDYYSAEGIGLTAPYLCKPEDYEEIDAAEAVNADGTPYKVEPLIDHVRRLKATRRRLKEIEREMNGLNLNPEQALEVKDWYPEWGESDGLREGDTVEAGTRFRFGDELWEVIQGHTILPHYEPSVNTAALYRRVSADSETGSRDNPIRYSGNMALEEGKYYRDSTDNLLYLCVRSSGTAVYHPLSALTGQYVEIEDETLSTE